MQKKLEIREFQLGGLSSDLLPWDMPVNHLTEIKNVRIDNGILYPFGGYDTWWDLPADFYPGFLMPCGHQSSDYWIIAGRDAVYSFDGDSVDDISSAGGYASIVDEDFWQGCMLSRIPILNHISHFPEYWPQQNPGIQLLPLPWDATRTWSDANERARIIRSHKNFLFALDLQSGSQEIPDGVRWSAPADIGSVPPTWDPLDTTNFAGLTTLGGAGGNIIDGRSLRDAFVVYREGAISIFDYVGGQFVWQIRHLSETSGLISPDALVEVKGSHLYIGEGDILFNDGNTLKSLLHARIRRRFAASFDVNNFYRSFAIRNNVHNEVWFCIPESGAEYPNIAFIYNWKDDTWTVRDLPQCPFANYGSIRLNPISWDITTSEWNLTIPIWNQNKISPLDESIVAVTKPISSGGHGKLLRLDRVLSQSEILFDTVIERISLPVEGLNAVSTVSEVYPHIRGPGEVFIQIGSQDFPGSAVRWKPAVRFNPEKDRKIDVRTTGELHCYRLFSRESKNLWEFSGMDIIYTSAGER